MRAMLPVSRSVFCLGLALFAAAAAFSGGTAQAGTPPLTYNAITNSNYYPKPALPALGSAGFIFTDPTFGCKIVRVTDQNTYSNNAIHTPAGSVQNTWNTDSTMFIAESEGSVPIPFNFNPSNLQVSRISGLSAIPQMSGDTPFSYHQSDLCYGKDTNRAVITKFNFTTRQSTDVLDVAAATGLPVVSGHMGMFCVSANDVISLCFGGASQNLDMYCLWYNTVTGQYHVWNTQAMTIDGVPVAGAVSMTMHACEIDLSGRYVMVTPGGGSNVRWYWDTQNGTVYTLSSHVGGHAVSGFGDMVNHDSGFYYRTLDSIGISNPTLIRSDPGRGYTYDTHTSWNNSRVGMHVPCLSSSEHAIEMPDPQLACGDEVFAVATDGSGTAWRFCHTRTWYHQPYNFWDTPRGNVSQDGKFFMFNSNWEDTLGTDRGGLYREDVFIVQLVQASSIGKTPPTVTGVTVNGNSKKSVSSIICGTIGVKTIAVTFSEPVTFQASDVLVRKVTFPGGVKTIGATVTPLSVAGSGTSTMTITLPDGSAVNTWLQVTLSGSGTLVDADGNLLDGEAPSGGSGKGYLSNSSDLPSGDGTAGGDAVFYVGSLVGDMNCDGRTNIPDIVAFNNAYGSKVGDANYNPEADLNGDGYINIQDIILRNNNYGLNLGTLP